VTVGHEDYFDVMLKEDEYSLDIAKQHAGFKPDLALVECFGPKPFFSGVEECSYPLALYAVDSSINLYWLEHYAKVFDFVFVDQKDAMISLRKKGIEADWLPLAIEVEDYPPISNTSEYDISFVGRMDFMRRKRHALIDQLKKKYSVTIGGGDGDDFLYFADAAKFHARGKMALNENLFDGVTHRIIEIMASGTMLLTEEVADGLSDLFTEGEHLVTFNPANLHEKVKELSGVYFIGLGGSNPTPFNTPLEFSEQDIYNKLSEMMSAAGTENKKNIVLITHCPPKDTKCDNALRGHVGSESLRKIIGEFQPNLAVSPHIHECGGVKDKIGETTVANIGTLAEMRCGIIDTEKLDIELMRMG